MPVMDEHQPSSNKKRKSAVALPSQKRCLIKKTKIPGNLAGTCALSQSPSKVSFISSSTSSNLTTRIPPAKNAKASPSTSPNAVSRSRDLTSLTRVSSRVSRPTFKKKALLSAKEPRLPESDGTPPLSVILPTPSPSLKQTKPRSSPTKRPAGNNTPSKRKWLDPDPIELTSSDDDSRPQPPRKRVKHTHKKPFGSEVIDLCSESEDVIPSPRHTLTQDERSVVLSTDEEMDLEFPALSHLAFKKIDTRCPALPPLRDISPPIEIESSQASPPPLAHNPPVPKPKPLFSKEDGVTDVNFPRGSLQDLYNEALTRCTREPRREKNISVQPSPFSSLKCVPPARIIRYATQTQSPSLHTPLFFNRIILRLRARLKQPKSIDSKAFSDARASFSNSKAFPDATTFSAISKDTLNSMEVSKFTEDQDTLTYSDAVMKISAVDSEALEIVTETILIPPIDFQDDTSSNTQVAIFEDTPILHSIQAPTTICEPTTPDSANSFAISPNVLCNTPSEAVDYQIETPNEDKTSFLFVREDCVDQAATIEPIVFKDAQSLLQELQQIYDVSEVYVHPALELNDTAKASATFESITNTASVSSSTGPSSNDVSCGLEYLSEFPAVPNLYPLSSSSSTDTLYSHASFLSTGSLQSFDSSGASESVACHLLTPNDFPSPLSPLVKAQKQESLVCSNPFPSPIDVSFDIDMSELNLQTIMCNMVDDDDDVSISGMELAYPEESHTIY